MAPNTSSKSTHKIRQNGSWDDDAGLDNSEDAFVTANATSRTSNLTVCGVAATSASTAAINASDCLRAAVSAARTMRRSLPGFASRLAVAASARASRYEAERASLASCSVRLKVLTKTSGFVDRVILGGGRRGGEGGVRRESSSRRTPSQNPTHLAARGATSRIEEGVREVAEATLALALKSRRVTRIFAAALSRDL